MAQRSGYLANALNVQLNTHAPVRAIALWWEEEERLVGEERARQQHIKPDHREIFHLVEGAKLHNVPSLDVSAERCSPRAPSCRAP